MRLKHLRVSTLCIKDIIGSREKYFRLLFIGRSFPAAHALSDDRVSVNLEVESPISQTSKKMSSLRGFSEKLKSLTMFTSASHHIRCPWLLWGRELLHSGSV